MSLYSRLKLRTRDFASDTDGNMAVEGLLASTILIWWYVASFQFFDTFRQKNTNLKAAYTIADLTSRQTNAINADFIEGLNTLFDYLTTSDEPTWIRISSVLWDEDEDRYDIAWSYATGEAEGHSTESIQLKANRIPVMPAGDTVILVETYMHFDPRFNVGIDERWLTTFIATRPRFAACVPFDKEDGSTPACIYDSAVDPDGEVHNDDIPVLPDDDDTT
ncbi:MAG: pilus assembly protein [Albidovulum sp.]|uniref:TadE/TadG family type IV pilus assembly protein n=1 Tax=Albidovulum sp. TaxID=1872424 RepID=UPI003C82AA98